ncbi:hypothetical protein BGZ46_007496 [Entomortierella lignicola]|nr:hypothetical protein BGZ46_007496 [Entomortierella lignicola]
MELKPDPLGPFGLRNGQTHHIVYFTIALVFGSITLVSTIITFILAKTENDLKQRGRYLVFWNGISAAVTVTMYLMLNSFAGNFPCFLLLWTSYMSTIPWLLTYLARAWRLVYIYNKQVDFGNTIIQRNPTLDLMNNNNTTNNKERLGVSKGGIGYVDLGPGPGGQGISGSNGSKGEEAVNDDDPMQAKTTKFNTKALNLNAPLPPLPISDPESHFLAQHEPNTNNIAIATTSPSALVPSTPNIISSGKPGGSNDESARTIDPLTGTDMNGVTLAKLNSNGTPRIADFANFSAVPVEPKHRWSRFLPFNQATDARLTIFLMLCMIIPFGVCLGIQFIKPSPVQINPTNYRCAEGSVFYPIYIIMLAFLAVGCPILIWKLWWIKDGFGIRNELFITMIIGLPGFVLYFVSPFKFKKLDNGHWNHVNWLVLTIFLAHVNSVVLPLIQFYMRQRPKERNKGLDRPFGSILRWDSPKTNPGTPNADIGSDTSSFHVYTRPSSQIISPQLQRQPLEFYDSSLGEHQLQSIIEFEGKDSDGLYVNIIRKATKSNRVRGMKGFWAKYGKDSDGKFIPLSRMNPRAFEYALQDAEMLNELVKFSVTVFSVENAKFLQEYDGLKKQVREYYRLAGHRSNREKHGQNTSDETGTVVNMTEEFASGLDLSSRSRRKKKRSNLVSLASSLHSKRSSGMIEDSPKPSREDSGVGNIAKWAEEIPGRDGDPGSSTGTPAYAPYPTKSFGKHRQDTKGNSWKLSIHSSLRYSNPPYVSPYGPVQEEVDAEAQQSDLPSSPHGQQNGGFGSQTFPSQNTISTEEEANEQRYEYGGNESEISTYSWYGRGNTGSTVSYHDITPSDIESEGNRLALEYFDDLDSSTDYSGDPNSNDKSSVPPSPKDELSSQSAPSSKPEAHSTFVRKHGSSYSLGSLPSGLMAADKTRENVGPSRPPHHINHSPYHSPSSSISATFSPRLPSQPHSHSHNSIRLMPSALQRSSSARNILTMKEYQNFELATDSITSETPAGPPIQSPIENTTEATDPLYSQSSVEPSKRSSSTPSWSQTRPSSLSIVPALPGAHHATESELPRRNYNIDMDHSNINGRTPVPKALLSAYWEICQTFIMPNAVLELNLPEDMVTEIRDLFLTSGCYLEMYEPVVREVQELVYANVWPRFIQSIQRQPQGRVKKAWNSLLRKGSKYQENEIYEGQSSGFSGWLNRGRVHDVIHGGNGANGSTSQDYLNRNVDSMELGSLQPMPAPTPLPPPPQSSYIHGQYSYLGMSNDQSSLPQGSRSGGDTGDMEQLDLGQFGVMQDLDFSALQHIVVGPK